MYDETEESAFDVASGFVAGRAQRLQDGSNRQTSHLLFSPPGDNVQSVGPFRYRSHPFVAFYDRDQTQSGLSGAADDELLHSYMLLDLRDQYSGWLIAQLDRRWYVIIFCLLSAFFL